MSPVTARKPLARAGALSRFNAAKPLAKPSKELFAQLVAKGVPVSAAYEQAGYAGGDATRSQLRRSPDVDGRVMWLLEHRVNEDTRARLGREKKVEDSRLRLLREVERLATSNIAEIVGWDRKAILGADGTVEGFTDEIVTTPSKRLSRATLSTVRSVTTKAGALKIELHGKESPLALWAKILGMGVDAAPVQSVTVNQVNVGDVNALEAARRLAFIMGRAAASPLLIEGEPVKTADTSE